MTASHQQGFPLIISWLEEVSNVDGSDQLHDRRKRARGCSDEVEEEDDINAQPGCPKRLRQNESSGAGLFSPPLTMSRSPSKRSISDEADVVATPRPPPRLRSGKRQTFRLSSPTKRASLQLLTPPVSAPQRISSNHTLLPPDVADLYSTLMDTKAKLRIIPSHLRGRIEGLEGAKGAQDHYFWTSSVTEAATAAEASTTAKASTGAGRSTGAAESVGVEEAVLKAWEERRFQEVLEILDAADSASPDDYHETGWNHTVHTALLRLVFLSSRPTNLEVTRARYVPAMCASIFPDCLPLRYGRPAETRSASSSAASQAPSTPSEAMSTMGTSEVAEVGRIVDGKKVDYTLGIEAGLGTPLSEVLRGVARDQNVNPDDLHINQTTYGPLQFGPIGVSIETKTAVASRDPLLQLGTWAAAWSVRMRQHRAFLWREAPDVMRRQDATTLRPPSTLLIDVVGHDWSVYFAVDGSDEQGISLYGPLSLGSTVSIADTYGIIASLEAIKVWLEGSFREAIERWFVVDEMAAAYAKKTADRTAAERQRIRGS